MASQADDDCASQAPSSLGFGGAPGVQGLPVSLNLSKPCQCCLCNSKSSDASPFHVAHEDDQYGGARPWNKYRKVRDPETDAPVRVPEGKICLICFSTFRGLGYHYKYGSYNAYYQQIRDNAAAHSEFLASVKDFISQKNDNPKMRIDKAALKQAGTTLHSETKSGVRFEGPEMEFVMLEHWDPKLDGQLDETKVVEETWKGKKVKGVWRQVGRQGVLKAHGYEDTNMTERTEEHSGTGPFAEQGLATKKQVLQSVFADCQRGCASFEGHNITKRDNVQNHARNCAAFLAQLRIRMLLFLHHCFTKGHKLSSVLALLLLHILDWKVAEHVAKPLLHLKVQTGRHLLFRQHLAQLAHLASASQTLKLDKKSFLIHGPMGQGLWVS